MVQGSGVTARSREHPIEFEKRAIVLIEAPERAMPGFPKTASRKLTCLAPVACPATRGPQGCVQSGGGGSMSRQTGSAAQSPRTQRAVFVTQLLVGDNEVGQLGIFGFDQTVGTKQEERIGNGACQRPRRPPAHELAGLI